MLTGVELGAAIKRAITLKGVSQREFADAMGVKPPSVQDWIKFGRLHKKHINNLVDYFSDVVPSEYWGIATSQNQHQESALLDADEISRLIKGYSLLNAAEREGIWKTITIALQRRSDATPIKRINNS